MVQFIRQQPPTAPLLQQRPDTVRNLPALMERRDLVTVAAWPAGVSQLAVAYDVCQQAGRLEMRSDWLAAIRN